MSNNRSKGFTIVELLIVMVVIAILGSIALPSYQETMRKGKRADAKNKLLEIAALQERRYSDTGAYSNLATIYGSATALSDEGHYTISSVQGVGAQTYTLTATPVVADPNCGNFTYNQAGVITESGTKDLDYCW